jgi:hypothetical protein
VCVLCVWLAVAVAVAVQYTCMLTLCGGCVTQLLLG